MGNQARALQPEYRILLSYEEAIGYAHGGAVVDKDGVSAAVIMADLANYLKTKDSTATVVDCLYQASACTAVRRQTRRGAARGSDLSLC